MRLMIFITENKMTPFTATWLLLNLISKGSISPKFKVSNSFNIEKSNS